MSSRSSLSSFKKRPWANDRVSLSSIFATLAISVVIPAAGFADMPAATTDGTGTTKELETVKVVASSDDYTTKEIASVGPWGSGSYLDTPYSISVFNTAMIDDLGAVNADDLFYVSPSAQIFSSQTRAGYSTSINLRGFNLSDAAEDGMRNTYGYTIALEDKERVEILTGLSGFLYGSGNVGGLVNYISKRPTVEQVTTITTGDIGGGEFYGHVDTGGPIGNSGNFGYRVNIASESGSTAIDNQSIDRWIASGAFDWHVMKNLVLEFNLSKQYYHIDGMPAYWAIASGVKRPDAPDSSKLWTQKWTYQNLNQKRFAMNANWDLTEHFTLRAACGYTTNDREWHAVNNTIKSATTYSMLYIMQAPARSIDRGSSVYLDSRFATGVLDHVLTVGVYDNECEKQKHIDAESRANMTGTFSLLSPLYVTVPTYTAVGTKPFYKNADTDNTNLIVGDSISLGEHWTAMLGVNSSSLFSDNYSTAGTVTSGYDKTKVTPTTSLVYKPLKWFSTYATYMESLENGVTVPTTGTTVYTNAGDVLAPLTSKQYEVGAKAVAGKVELSAALFRIEKSNQLDVTNADKTHTYIQDGLEVHQGVEFDVSGKVIGNLTLFGGITLMNAEIKDQQTDASLEGNCPLGIAEQIAKLHAEYEIPGLKGLAITGGINYTGAFYSDAANTDKLPSVVTLDAGARYKFTVVGKETTLRVNATNLTDKSYWESPYYVGDPMEVTVMAEIKF